MTKSNTILPENATISTPNKPLANPGPVPEPRTDKSVPSCNFRPFYRLLPFDSPSRLPVTNSPSSWPPVANSPSSSPPTTQVTYFQPIRDLSNSPLPVHDQSQSSTYPSHAVTPTLNQSHTSVSHAHSGDPINLPSFLPVMTIIKTYIAPGYQKPGVYMTLERS